MRTYLTLLAFWGMGMGFVSGQGVTNGDFASGAGSWGCNPEINMESVYGGVSGSNPVAEIDDEVNLCQTISGFIPGDVYVLSYVASRRLGGCPGPDPADVNVSIGSLSTIDSRSNTVWGFTASSFSFVANSSTETLSITPNFPAFTTCGFILDDISITHSGPLAAEVSGLELEDRGNGQVGIRWSVIGEMEGTGFVVERSGNLRDWGLVGRVGNGGTEYDVVDRIGSGDLYYRLSHVDVNGVMRVLRMAQFHAEAGALVGYPNPCVGMYWLEGEGVENGLVQVVDGMGRLHALVPVAREHGRIGLDLGGLERGMYVVQVKSGEAVLREKVIVGGGI